MEAQKGTDLLKATARKVTDMESEPNNLSLVFFNFEILAVHFPPFSQALGK